jgi:predicted nucleotidyltransferase
MIMTDTKEIIEKIAHILRPVKSIGYVFLFGSALRKLLPQSDVDILIGGELDINQRLLMTAELSRGLSRNVDLVLVREAHCELVLKAMSQGVPVFVQNREMLKQDYITNWRSFDDNTGLRGIRFARIQRQYANG